MNEEIFKYTMIIHEKSGSITEHKFASRSDLRRYQKLYKGNKMISENEFKTIVYISKDK